MYEIVIIKAHSNETVRGDFYSKKESVRMISKETGLSNRDIASDFEAKANSFIKRDGKGYRVEVYYTK